jgi:nucleoside-diphosphate kinase
MERTLILIKPDGIQRELAGTIIERFERRSLKIVGMKMIHMDEKMARKHYGVHEGKPFFEGLISYITSSPIIAMVLEGPNAIAVVRSTMGETNAGNAMLGTIRGDYAITMERNLVHGSDSLETAADEINLFFAKEEIFKYTKDTDK